MISDKTFVTETIFKKTVSMLQSRSQHFFGRQAFNVPIWGHLCDELAGRVW